ncbi:MULTISPECIES: hypothetical protein [unclassified Streptomyces]|uniref:hypothetical protein n=1 Tax=unclassified Streptomyces TaxID=2593676 RepID=UPI00210DDD56|nr:MULTISPECIES: hypothetical protein [unclassified Streptomyces]
MRAETEELSGGVTLRLLARGDVDAMCAAYVANRRHLQPWEPVRPESFFTAAGQSRRVHGLLRQFAEGTALPMVLVAEDGRIVGAGPCRGSPGARS